MGMQTRRPHGRRPRHLVTPALLAALWATHAGATTCANLCTGSAPSPCVVTAQVNVTPGAVVDCTGRAVQVTGGNLRVTGGSFTLKAASLFVGNSKKIETVCSGANVAHGFRIETTGNVTTSSGGGLRATCGTGGGNITIVSGNSVWIAGAGIDARGTTQAGHGGTVEIEAAGPFVSAAPIEANAVAGSGPGVSGGGIDIRAATVSVGADLNVSGYKLLEEHAVRLEATDFITVSGGTVDASTDSGDGGHISLEAGGAITIDRVLKASGSGAQSAGGTVQVTGDSILVRRDIDAHGGYRGGGIFLEARRKIDIGTGATQPFELNADRANNDAGTGGEISLVSEGHDVIIDGSANIHSSGPSEGGIVTIEGVDVTARIGSKVRANGGPGQGGTIDVTGRGTIVLSGVMGAKNGAVIVTYRKGAPVPPFVGTGVSDLDGLPAEDPNLMPACGDGVRRDPAEACDEPDLGGLSCCTTECTPCN